MIFVSVGQQIGFDRLVRAVDGWAYASGHTDIFAQIHNGSPPAHIPWARMLAPDAYRRHVMEADLIVGHAGMGVIITGLCAAKPMLLMARRGSLGETRNDHQVETLRRFGGRDGIVAAADEGALMAELDRFVRTGALAPVPPREGGALITTVRSFIAEGVAPRVRPDAQASHP